jgi:3-methyladenine DNA glycosylase AlkD
MLLRQNPLRQKRQPMPKHEITPAYIAEHVRRVLKHGGSAAHAAGVQRFFKEEIQSRGWYTGKLRKVSVRFRRTILKECGLAFLVKVADELFSGEVLEEKAFAVYLLENQIENLGDREFRLFEKWIGRISSWADHDALVHYLIAPLVAADRRRTKDVFRWAKSRDRWHRRAACVALIQGTRKKMFFPEIVRLSNFLLTDRDDMVHKGLGWLLRETAKADAKTTIPYLLGIRQRAPRLVLRTACETLPGAIKRKILVALERARTATA